MSLLTLLSILWVVVPILLIGAVLAVWGRRRQTLPITLVLFVGILLAGVTSMFAAAVFWGPVPEPLPQPIIVVIEAGNSSSQVASRLEAGGVVSEASTLVRAARLTGKERAFQAGRYRFPGGEGVLKVLSRLTNGSTAEEFVTIPEGLRVRQVASIVARSADVDSAAFVSLVADTTFIATVLPVVEGKPLPANLEGYLLPETYNIYYKMPAEEVIRLMVNHFTDLWESRLAGPARAVGLSRSEVVTLASIVEREAATAAERPIISSVFHNRLKRGMRLQSCATVLYALGRYKPRLYERDLQVDSPYNTYRHAGLPPGPIANPGAASLIAAVNPVDEGYLYFVARGDGTHTFSRTYAEHLRAKRAAGEGVLVGGRAAQEAAAAAKKPN